ncbi:MAG: hypothetical protein JWN39_3777, partial [Ilumatobacteraceae bacterium]|nr:hypothetical protein [Ilumatobacteraceae bacterium]
MLSGVGGARLADVHLLGGTLVTAGQVDCVASARGQILHR